MNYDDFIKNYYEIFKRAMFFSIKAWRDGLLALEDCIDAEKADNRDIFEYGMRFVVDGTDPELIDKILSNIINQEKDEYSKTLKIIQEEAVLSIQAGDNIRILAAKLNSYTDLPFDEDSILEGN